MEEDVNPLGTYLAPLGSGLEAHGDQGDTNQTAPSCPQHPQHDSAGQHGAGNIVTYVHIYRV